MKVAISTDGGENYAVRDYSGAMPWTLPSGTNEEITFYVKFQDRAGNWSDPVSRSIIVDSASPIGSIGIDNWSNITGTRDVEITVDVEDSLSGAEELRYSLDDGASWSNWQDFQEKINEIGRASCRERV